MDQSLDLKDASKLASQIEAEIRALPVPDTAAVRALRRQYSRKMKGAEAGLIINLATLLIEKYGRRWLAYEFVRNHPAAFLSLDEAKLEELGRGINSWDTVDAFARILAGPAWLKGQVPDALIQKWAASAAPWWRRAALVSTVALNLRSQGGHGDVPHTLAICRLLAHDHEESVSKALSWALRELVVHDPQAVTDFLAEHKAELPARVKREVRNKLTTGLKYPRRKLEGT